jgi:hypothetical protein
LPDVEWQEIKEVERDECIKPINDPHFHLAAQVILQEFRDCIYKQQNHERLKGDCVKSKHCALLDG